MEEKTTIKPQKGFQEKFLSSSADIVIGGGSGGAGKSFALLLEFFRYINNPKFRGVIFRRLSDEVSVAGGLWDTSINLFMPIAEPNETLKRWRFKSGGEIKMTHLQHEKHKYSHQGSQYDYIAFDELTHFTESQFFYLLSRNRSVSGIKPLVRATCNPAPDSWVHNLIRWWIDEDTGYPIPERDSKLRYFTKDGDSIVWGDSEQEVVDKAPHIFNNSKLKGIKKSDLIKSLTFIRGSVYENKELLAVNPAYIGTLMSLDEEDKKRLLDGNWKYTQDDLSLFEYTKVQDLFSNKIDVVGSTYNRYITCDVARFGRDLAVINVWNGKRVEECHIWNKSSIDLLKDEIEKIRARKNIQKSQTLVDEDGVGGGLVDVGGYVGFGGNSATITDKTKQIKENYQNLKTQCVYRMAEEVNQGLYSFDGCEFFVNGQKNNRVIVEKKEYAIIELIKKDLLSYKRVQNYDAKKQIESKEKQKIRLDGRSPDFGDTFFMREFFELNKKPNYEPIFFT